MPSRCGSCITAVLSSAPWPVCLLILWTPGKHLRSSSRISFVLRAAGSPAHVPMLPVQVRYPQPWPLSHWRQVGRRGPPLCGRTPSPSEAGVGRLSGCLLQPRVIWLEGIPRGRVKLLRPQRLPLQPSHPYHAPGMVNRSPEPSPCISWQEVSSRITDAVLHRPRAINSRCGK